MFKYSLPMSSLIFLLSLLSLLSCKTAEQVRRERMVDDLSVKIVESEKKMDSSQKQSVDLMMRIQNIENRLNQLQGVQEETLHEQKNSQTGWEDRIKNLEMKMEKMEKDSQEFSQQMKEQKKFMDKVLKTLESVQRNLQKGASNSFNSTGKRKKDADHLVEAQDLGNEEKNEQTDLDLGLQLFQSGNFPKARTHLKQALEQTLPQNKKFRVLHNLGLIEYESKKYEDSMIYFSKIYTDGPRSTYAANSLLHIGKILQKLGKKDEAQEALNQLLKKYPNSTRIGEAKSILATIN